MEINNKQEQINNAINFLQKNGFKRFLLINLNDADQGSINVMFSKAEKDDEYIWYILHGIAGVFSRLGHQVEKDTGLPAIEIIKLLTTDLISIINENIKEEKGRTLH